MSYIYQEKDGYRFICTLFWVITRNGAMKDVFKKKMKDISGSDNDEKIRTFLKENWYQFSVTALNRNPEIAEKIRDHYQTYHPEKGDWKEQTDAYRDTWKPKNCNADKIVNGIETRNPYVALGIAATVAAAMETTCSSADFYIGRDEAQKLLFLCLEYFEYQNIEFIPDEYFGETENLRKLLFSALYSTLLFLYPDRSVTRKINFEKGKAGILRVLHSDTVSELFAAFQYVAEAKDVAEQLWKPLDINEQYIAVLNTIKLPMSEFLIVPDIDSGAHMGVLTCERGQTVRSLVEGRSGCGKSTLARLIALICQNEFSGFVRYREAADRLDCRRKMLPLIIDCKELTAEDMGSGMIGIGLKQMLFRTVRANGTVNYQHFKECERYLTAYCSHKIMREELLLVIDDYSKIPENCINEFNRQLKGLCRNPKLHVVVITDRLQPSAKFRLSEAFNGMYNEFTLKDTLIDAEYLSSVIKVCSGGVPPEAKADTFAQMYVNTPRRLLRYAESLLCDQSILELMDSSLEDEMDTCKSYIDFRDEYPDFVRRLTLRALRNRREKEKNHSRLTISEKTAIELTDKNDRLKAIWKCIKTESILLERCNGVNSMEFSTPLYFYSVLVDYYMDILQDRCDGMFAEEFSYLSCVEFANVVFLIFRRLYEEDFESISDSNAEYFIRAIAARIFEMETVQDHEYCQWALSSVMSEDYRKVFIHGGNPQRRERMWRTLKRIFISLNMCKDVFYESGLLLR